MNGLDTLLMNTQTQIMNPSSNSFDTSLKEISHYQSFPAMLPFVGQDYVSSNHSKLLVLGESFGFPEESTFHKDPVRWYSKNQNSLTEEEVEYIHCRNLLECDWGSPGHEMYRELNRCLVEVGLPSQNRPVSHICYANTFLRPADSGAFFKHCCVEQDVAMSIDVLTRVIAVLAPDLVIFASKYSWEVVGRRIAPQVSGTTFDFVCHPTAHFYWNVESYNDGRIKFVSLLKKWAIKPE